MDSEKLNAFRIVAREKSFSRAAEKLYRTQPAVSQAIRLLEDELGERLFLRLGRSIRITQAGEILLEEVEKSFDLLDRARARIEALKELREGTLTVTASDTTSCYLLPGVLGEFRDRYPNVEIRILNRRSPEAVAEVESREADIGIITLPLGELPAGIDSEPLIIREDVAICAPGHPLASRKKITFSRLLDYPLVLLDRGSNTRTFIDRKIEESGRSPRIAMELGAIDVIKKLVSLDFGVSMVPRISVEDDVARGTLHAIRVFRQSDCRTLGLIYPAGGIVSLAAQVFGKMLRSRVGERATM